MTLRQILSVAICVIVSLVLLAIATRYFHPHWSLAILHSLQLHAAVGCIVALLLAFFLHRSRIVALLLVAAVALAAHAVAMNMQSTAMAGPDDADAPGFRLLSFNILMSNDANGQAIAEMIAASGADVVNIMEAGPLQPHLGELMRTYPYRIGCGVQVAYCDQLMLSKTPLHGTVRSLSPLFADRFILAETEIKGHKVNVAGIHTSKPYFDTFQTAELVKATLAITATTGPLVLSGDFNASSLQPNIRAFLSWSGLEKASWEPPTWPVELGALGLPIDHVFVHAPLKIRSIENLLSAYGSNHAGLIADIAITGK